MGSIPLKERSFGNAGSIGHIGLENRFIGLAPTTAGQVNCCPQFNGWELVDGIDQTNVRGAKRRLKRHAEQTVETDMVALPLGNFLQEFTALRNIPVSVMDVGSNPASQFIQGTFRERL